MGIFERFFGPPSRDKFAQVMINAIKQAGEPAEIRYDEQEFRLLREGEQANQLNLSNAYHEYCSGSKDDRHRLVRSFVSAWFAPLRGVPEEFEDARCDLLPIVRDRGYFEINGLRCRLEHGEPPDWPYQPLGEHFAIGVAYDLPESIVQVMQHHLDEWGVTFYESIEAAKQNLEEITREAHFASPVEGLYISQFDDIFDCSRVLLPEVFESLDLKGRPVIMAPNRSVLLVTGADEEDGLMLMAEVASNSLEEQSRPQIGVALHYIDGDWEPFMPPQDHPARPLFRRLWLQSMGELYAEQKLILDAIHEKDHEDISVANFSGLEKEGSGELVSYCVWPKDADSLLPRTEVIMFVKDAEDDGQAVVAKWNDVWEKARHLLQVDDDLYPSRLRTRGFPDDELLAALGSGAY